MPRLPTSSFSLLGLALSAQVLFGQDPAPRGVRIGISYTTDRPGVAVLPIAGPSGDSIRAILQRDLDFGDRVAVVGQEALAAAPSDFTSGSPNYVLLSRLGAAAAVQASVTGAGVRVTLHDVGAKRVAEVEEFALTGVPPSREWRHSVHGISDALEEWITGVRGIAQSRIAYVRGGELRVVDSDGASEVRIPTPGRPLSPAWHPSGEMLGFNTFGLRSEVVVYDPRSGRSRTVSLTRGGVNQTPAFAPDGRSLVYAHAYETGEGSDLFVVGLDGDAQARRITVARGTINVSPSFSPDGRRLVFTSSRSGHPEVYVMDADGTNAELLTPYVFGEQSYQSNPDWSPDGRLVAYQSQIAGRFQLKTINLRDRTTRQLTSEGQNEDPSWAPDGRHLVFASSRTGVRELWIIDVETGRARQLTRGGGGARLPAWSRRLRTTQSP
jgi:TolB protein